MQRTLVVLAALALAVACAPGFAAAIEWAGSPVIELNANDLTPGATGADIVWENRAAPGGAFESDPLQIVQPTVKQSAIGQSGVTKNYVEFVRGGAGGYGDDASFLLWSEVAPDTISQGSGFSVEGWVYLTCLDELQTYFSIARRAGPDALPDPPPEISTNNFACSAGWVNTGGTSNRAIGLATTNLTWLNPPQLAPSYNYFAGTYDDTTLTVSVYVNGELNNSLVLGAPLDIFPDQPVYLGAMWFSGNAKYIQQGLKNGGLAVLRVHDGVLTADQVRNNFEAEQADFIAYRPIFDKETPVAATVGAGAPCAAARRALIAPVFLTPPSTDIAWSLTGAVPAGIAIDASDGTIRVARTVAVGSYDVTVVATNSFGTDSIPVALTVTAEFYGLWVSTYDATQGVAYLNPISNLMAIPPSGTAVQTDDITYPADFNFAAAFPGLTDNESFAMLWQGRFNVAMEGHGDYTFGTESDDGSVIYLDLNDDGDFRDAGELVVNSNVDQPPTVLTASTTLEMDSVRIAIAFYENGGGQAMTARFGPGAGLTWFELAPIGGVSGHFTVDAPKTPTGLAATADAVAISLDWDDSTAADFASYNVYRSTTAGGGYGAALASGLTASAYTDSDVAEGVAYYYVVTAVNSHGYESALSAEATATPGTNDVYVFMGDVNGDAKVDIADAISLLGYLFGGGTKPPPGCAKAADANDDDKLDIADAVKILGYLFAGGAMNGPDGSVVSSREGAPAACTAYAAGAPNFPDTINNLPACETPCQ